MSTWEQMGSHDAAGFTADEMRKAAANLASSYPASGSVAEREMGRLWGQAFQNALRAYRRGIIRKCEARTGEKIL